MKKPVLILILIIAAVLVVGGYFAWKEYFKKPAEEKSAEEIGQAAEKISETITESAVRGVLPSIAPSNPLEKMPELNPVEKINPFKGGYENPF